MCSLRPLKMHCPRPSCLSLCSGSCLCIYPIWERSGVLLTQIALRQGQIPGREPELPQEFATAVLA
jgi:hypothetical protein